LGGFVISFELTPITTIAPTHLSLKKIAGFAAIEPFGRVLPVPILGGLAPPIRQDLVSDRDRSGISMPRHHLRNTRLLQPCSAAEIATSVFMVKNRFEMIFSARLKIPIP
jgi:hypothetical protein